MYMYDSVNTALLICQHTDVIHDVIAVCACNKYKFDNVCNKMLSYRREIAPQGELVLTKTGRLELKDSNFTDIIDLSSST